MDMEEAVACVAKPNLTTWNWCLEDLNDFIGKKVHEVISEAFVETPPHIFLPYFYSEEGSPLRVRICVPVGPNMDDDAEWECSLEGSIKDQIEMFRMGDGHLEETGRQCATALSAALRELAGWLDAQAKE